MIIRLQLLCVTVPVVIEFLTARLKDHHSVQPFVLRAFHNLVTNVSRCMFSSCRTEHLV